MHVTGRLSGALNRRDEVPNIELAEKIAATNDTTAVNELIDNLQNGSKRTRHDSIKVLYETANRNPELLAFHHHAMFTALQSNDNRMVWGAMAALDAIVLQIPGIIFRKLSIIEMTALKGSVITCDHAVSLLLKLSTVSKFRKETMGLLLLLLSKCAVNQLPMYAELSLPLINEQFKASLKHTLISRLPELKKESKQKRMQRVLRKL